MGKDLGDRNDKGMVNAPELPPPPCLSSSKHHAVCLYGERLGDRNDTGSSKHHVVFMGVDCLDLTKLYTHVQYLCANIETIKFYRCLEKIAVRVDRQVPLTPLFCSCNPHLLLYEVVSVTSVFFPSTCRKILEMLLKLMECCAITHAVQY